MQKIVAFHGVMGSGKDTAADFLIQSLEPHSQISWTNNFWKAIAIAQSIPTPNYNRVQKFSFARKLRDSLCCIISQSKHYKLTYESTLTREHKAQLIPANCFQDVDDLVERFEQLVVRDIWHIFVGNHKFIREKSKRSCKILQDSIQNGTCTIGLALQIFGTEIGRNIWDANLWVNLTMREITNFFAPSWVFPLQCAVITDLRFPNEYALVNSSYPSQLYYIDAKKRLETKSHLDGRNTQHESEKTLPLTDKIKVIDNNGTQQQFIDILKPEFESTLVVPSKLNAFKQGRNRVVFLLIIMCFYCVFGLIRDCL